MFAIGIYQIQEEQRPYHEIPTCESGIYSLSGQKLLVAAGRILQCMKHSLTFTDPHPTLAEIEAAFEDYQQKVYAAAGGGLIYNTAKRESKRRLADLLQKLAHYVNVVGDGHLPTLHSSGFPVMSPKRKGRSPETPKQPFLRDGRTPGEVAFGFKPVGRDMFYDYCFATAVDKRGSEVYFRVRARNKHGASHWTQPIHRWVR